MTKAKWTLIFDDNVRKNFKKLDPPIQKRILKTFKEKILIAEDPKIFADQLVGDLHGLERFRIGDYRIICKIEDLDLIITAVEIAHRRDVYTSIKRKIPQGKITH